jgi:hypothetical protein
MGQRRTIRRRRRGVLKAGLPLVTVRGLVQYDDQQIDVELRFDTTLIPGRRAKDFPLGKKFKLVPLE